MNKQQKIGWSIVWMITAILFFLPVILYGFYGIVAGFILIIAFRLLFSLFFCCSCGQIAFLKHGDEIE